MLILTRKPGERIHIGDDITITIVDRDRNKIRVGIEAPRGVGIWREEISPRAATNPPAEPQP